MIELYNEIARKALSGTDTVINDLYAHTKNVPPEYCSDMTHYNTPEGAAYMGGKVLAVIAQQLGIMGKDIKAEGFQLENYSADNIGY